MDRVSAKLRRTTERAGVAASCQLASSTTGWQAGSLPPRLALKGRPAMTAAFCLALCLAFPPDDVWTFRDEAQREGRSVVTFRTVELTDAPGKPLHADDRPPPEVKHGTIALGPSGKLRLGLVFHAATNAVWL